MKKPKPVPMDTPAVVARGGELRDLGVCRYWVPLSMSELVALAHDPQYAALRACAASYLQPMYGESPEMFTARMREADGPC